MPDTPGNETDKKFQWFESYTHKLDNQSQISGPNENGEAYRCPCCHYKTLSERGGYEICPVCFWEDDGQDNDDSSSVRGGPNGSLSLDQARQNYLKFGVFDITFKNNVRLPTPQEE